MSTRTKFKNGSTLKVGITPGGRQYSVDRGPDGKTTKVKDIHDTVTYAKHTKSGASTKSINVKRHKVGFVNTEKGPMKSDPKGAKFIKKK